MRAGIIEHMLQQAVGASGLADATAGGGRTPAAGRSRTPAEPGAGHAPAGVRALADLDTLVTQARSLTAATATADQWSGPQRTGALRRLDLLAAALAPARAALLIAEQNAQTSIRPGDRDFAAARARITRTGLGHARRDLNHAHTLQTLTTVADAVQDGRVPSPTWTPWPGPPPPPPTAQPPPWPTPRPKPASSRWPNDSRSASSPPPRPAWSPPSTPPPSSTPPRPSTTNDS